MKQRRIASSGLKVSEVGIGCNNLGGRIDAAASRETVHAALDLGITLFDTADAYGNCGGSEEALGEYLGPRRKDIVLATKFGLPMDEAGTLRGGSRRYMMRAVEDSLRRLKTDWIDLYYLHRFDPDTPVEETLRGLDDLVHSGKVRYIACSNFTGWQVVDAHWRAIHNNLTPFICCQDELSLIKRGNERELIPAIEACGIGFMPYFPLASGLLTGKYKRNQTIPEGSRFARIPRFGERYMTDENMVKVEALSDFVEKRGKTLLELAFSWLLMRPSVPSVIAGATSRAQLEANVKAVEWVLSPEDMAEVEKITGTPA